MIGLQSSLDNGLTESQRRMYVIMQPLQQENTSLEYIHQLKLGLEVDRRFRLIEQHYTDILSKIISLKEQITCEKEIFF